MEKQQCKVILFVYAVIETVLIGMFYVDQLAKHWSILLVLQTNGVGISFGVERSPMLILSA